MTKKTRINSDADQRSDGAKDANAYMYAYYNILLLGYFRLRADVICTWINQNKDDKKGR